MFTLLILEPHFRTHLDQTNLGKARFQGAGLAIPSAPRSSPPLFAPQSPAQDDYYQP